MSRLSDCVLRAPRPGRRTPCRDASRRPHLGFGRGALAAAAEKPCGELRDATVRYAVIAAQGSVSCDQARYIVYYVLTHGQATMGSPGQAPAGWMCGWGYRHAEGQRGGRIGPSCESGPIRAGAGRERRVEGRPFLFSTMPTDDWPYPLPRRTASVEARGYMPLLFLDDDEHWPLSNPDWFLHTADVSHCPTATVYDGCRPVTRRRWRIRLCTSFNSTRRPIARARHRSCSSTRPSRSSDRRPMRSPSSRRTASSTTGGTTASTVGRTGS